MKLESYLYASLNYIQLCSLAVRLLSYYSIFNQNWLAVNKLRRILRLWNFDFVPWILNAESGAQWTKVEPYVYEFMLCSLAEVMFTKRSSSIPLFSFSIDYFNCKQLSASCLDFWFCPLNLKPWIWRPMYKNWIISQQESFLHEFMFSESSSSIIIILLLFLFAD